MSRGLSTAAATAVQQERVLRTVAVELLFGSGPVRLNGSAIPLSIDGHDYPGVGALGSIGVVEEGADLQSYGLTVSLAGIPRDAVAIAMAEPYQGRRATVWEVLLDTDTWQVIADPVVVFRGRMDQMTPTLGESASVAITLQNRLADWERAPNWRVTDEDQQHRHPGDKFLNFVSAVTEKEIVWPGKNFSAGGSGGPAGSIGALFAGGG